MINKVILIGNLGADPELRHTSGGQPVCELRIATSERFKDKSGEWTERTEWHRVVVWGRQGENCAQYLSKGRRAYVEGRLQTREWQAQDGATRRTTEVIAQVVKFLGGREGGGPGRFDAPPPPGDGDAPINHPGDGGAPTNHPGDGSFSDDEIPF